MAKLGVTVSQSLRSHLSDCLKDIAHYAPGRILEPQLGSYIMLMEHANNRLSAIIEAMDRQKDLHGERAAEEASQGDL